MVPGGGGVLLLFSGPGLGVGEIGLIMLLGAVLDRASDCLTPALYGKGLGKPGIRDRD